MTTAAAPESRRRLGVEAESADDRRFSPPILIVPALNNSGPRTLARPVTTF